MHRAIPRRAISFGFVGSTGVIVQLITSYILIIIFGLNFEIALPFSVVTAASTNFLINNSLTFRIKRLRNKKLIWGLFKFLLVSSFPFLKM